MPVMVRGRPSTINIIRKMFSKSENDMRYEENEK